MIIYSFLFYNRLLSIAEIKTNINIDKLKYNEKVIISDDFFGILDNNFP